MNKGTDAHSSKTETPFSPFFEDYPQLVTSNPKILNGEPCFTGTRIPIKMLDRVFNQEVRQVLEGLRPPERQLVPAYSTYHKYQGKEYPSCLMCGDCPGAVNAFIDSLLERYT